MMSFVWSLASHSRWLLAGLAFELTQMMSLVWVVAVAGSRSAAYDAANCDVLAAFVSCLMMPMAVWRMRVIAGDDVQWIWAPGLDSTCICKGEKEENVRHWHIRLRITRLTRFVHPSPFHTTSSTQAATDGSRSRRKFSNFFSRPDSITRNVFLDGISCASLLPSLRFVSPSRASRLSEASERLLLFHTELFFGCHFFPARSNRVNCMLLKAPRRRRKADFRFIGLESCSRYDANLYFHVLIIFIISTPSREDFFSLHSVKCLEWRLSASPPSTSPHAEEISYFFLEDTNRNRWCNIRLIALQKACWENLFFPSQRGDETTNCDLESHSGELRRNHDSIRPPHPTTFPNARMAESWRTVDARRGQPRCMVITGLQTTCHEPLIRKAPRAGRTLTATRETSDASQNAKERVSLGRG